jgi:hypothetical protein
VTTILAGVLVSGRIYDKNWQIKGYLQDGKFYFPAFLPTFMGSTRIRDPELAPLLAKLKGLPSQHLWQLSQDLQPNVRVGSRNLRLRDHSIGTFQGEKEWRRIMSYARHYPESLRSSVEMLDRIGGEISPNLAPPSENGIPASM